MSDLLVKRFDAPDSRGEFAHGHYEVITLGPLTLGREFLEAGWRWSTHVKPLVGTERCEVRHVGFQVSGRWVCEARDGTQVEIGPGDAFDVAAGHDAWVVGDEPAVIFDFQGAEYATPSGAGEQVLATLLFTDIVGSTALVERLGDAAWKRLLRNHLEDVHVLLGTHRGVLVDTAGDGIFARFASPGDALRCARAIVETSRRHDLEVRVGVHTAAVEVIDGDVRGVGVHLAARIMAAAGPSEIFVSGTTRELAAGANLAFADAGEFELKGISGARALYRLES